MSASMTATDVRNLALEAMREATIAGPNVSVPFDLLMTIIGYLDIVTELEKL